MGRVTLPTASPSSLTTDQVTTTDVPAPLANPWQPTMAALLQALATAVTNHTATRRQVQLGTAGSGLAITGAVAKVVGVSSAFLNGSASVFLFVPFVKNTANDTMSTVKYTDMIAGISGTNFQIVTVDSMTAYGSAWFVPYNNVFSKGTLKGYRT